ncbi:MAG: SAM-dependent methyltransferase [Alphaproteobacteria bacterium]|nr:SAM-dependent methyltransferase [Alphaproteobacteria bacterium]
MSVSKKIVSNQEGVHENLEMLVRKHLDSDFRKPIADHTRRAFAAVCRRIDDAPNRPLILDACCGVGDSSRELARQYPDHWIIGIDKSEHRLLKERPGGLGDNLILMRADLNDFYRLAVEASWTLARHYILYPNPWPKSVHLKRRWHGAPVFPFMLRLGGELELRSNWRTYLDEFALALGVAGYQAELEAFEATHPLTPFERKYRDSGQPLFRLTAML